MLRTARFPLAYFDRADYSAEEVQIKQARIDNLKQALDALQKQNALIREQLRNAVQMNQACSREDAAERQGSVAAGSQQSIMHVEGQGSRSTRPFVASGPWELRWSIAQSNGGPSWFSLHPADESGSEMIAGQDGDGDGQTFYPRAGAYYLEVHADGVWVLEVDAVTTP